MDACRKEWYHLLMPEKQEHIRAQIPYPELTEPEAVDYELTRTLLLSRTQPQEGVTVTPLDLRRIPKRMTRQEILDSVSAHLGVALGTIDSPASSQHEREQIEKTLADINTALSDAGSYIRRILHLPAPSAEVHSKKDVVDLILKASLYRSTERKHLEPHSGYCALISVALAVFELQRQESHTLEVQMRHIENRLIARPGESSKSHDPLFFAHSSGDTAQALNVVINGLNPQCRAKISMRDKSKDSQITKYLRKPESSAEEALKDAIGIRVELENPRIEEGLVRILNYFQEHLGATNLKVEDSNLLKSARLGDFRRRKAEDISHGDKILVTADTSPLSADSFRAVKITGKIKIPRSDKPDELVDRPIEVQIVEPENKNESGLSSHAVYEFKKLVTVMTRLFGGCSEGWISKQLGEIAREEGFNDKFVNNTITGLQETGFMVKLPKTPNKRVYASSEVYRRWLKVDGLIEDDKIRAQVMHTLQAERP